MNHKDDHIENITMPDRSVWLQLGEIRKYKPHPHSDPEKEIRKDRRIFIRLDEIASVGHGSDDNDDGSVSAAVVIKGGETIHLATTLTKTMEIIQKASVEDN